MNEFPRIFDPTYELEESPTLPGHPWRAGDLLCFYGRDWTSRIIELATGGPSHVGIVSHFSGKGFLLAESTTLCDLSDAFDGRRERGVQFHVPDQRIAAYNGRVTRMSLSNGNWLTAREIGELTQFLWRMREVPYDLRGALWSGTRLLKLSGFFPYPDSRSLFCSELCAAALMRVGRLGRGNPTLFNPAALKRRLLWDGTYDAPVPLT